MTLDRLTQITSVGITSGITLNNATLTGVTTIASLDSVSVGGTITAVNGTFSGNVSIAGTLTYEDVTNIDSVGLITARSGINIENAAPTLNLIDTDGSTTSSLLGNSGNIYYSTSSSNRDHIFRGSTTEVARITGDGNIGIGTDNPQRLLHLYSGSNNPLLIESPDQFADIVQADTGGSTRLRSDQGALKFYTGGDASSVQALNATERLGITSTGDINVAAGSSVFIANGNLVFSTSGTGIDFSAASGSAAGSSSAVLDDYEEGTWTPTLTTTGIDFDSVTYTVRIGNYTKIGDLVFIACNFYSSAVVKGSASGNVAVTGLPFTPASLAGACLHDVRLWDGNPSTATINNASSSIRLHQRATFDGNDSSLQVSDVRTSNPGNLCQLSGCYKIT